MASTFEHKEDWPFWEVAPPPHGSIRTEAAAVGHVPMVPEWDGISARTLRRSVDLDQTARPSDPADPMADASSTLEPLSEPHIVVISEQLDLLDVLGLLFREEGYSITLSSQLLDAPTIVRIAPSAVVLDVPYDGVDASCALLRQLRQRQNGFPIVCSTTVPMVAECIRLHGAPALLKPFDLEEILTMVTGFRERLA